MKKVLFILSVLFSSICFSQSKLINKVVLEICDELSNSKKQIENFTQQETQEIIQDVLKKNQTEWIKEFKKYSDNSKNLKISAYLYNQHFLHVLEIKCPKYRIINKKFDNYISNKKELRRLYFQSEDFIYALEDQKNMDDIFKYLDKNLQNKNTSEILEKSKIEIEKYSKNASVSNILVYKDGFTFRVRYTNFKTDLTKFQIDIIFSDSSDIKIDEIHIKDKDQLTAELKENAKFIEKVNNGELSIPPPPAPKN